jgi:hypothetical protein
MEHCLDELPVLEAAGRRFRNVYEVQRALIRHYALRNYLSTDAAGLPVITDTYLQAFVKSRVQFRRQGASQPSLDERTQRCRAIITTAPGETASAWELFNDQVRLQEDMTALQYNDPAAEAAYQWYPALSFITDLEQQEQPYTFPPAFNGYYDNRPFARLTPSWLLPLTDAEKARYTFETLYTPANTTRIKLLFRDRQDAETLQAIAGEQIPVDHFEFDGQTYPADQASGLLTALNAALAQEEAWLYEQDCFAFRFHYTQALEKGENQRKAMLQLYEKVVPHQERMQQMSEVVTRIVDCSSILLSSPQLRPEEMFAWLEMLDIAVDQFHEQLKGLFQYLHVIHTWDIKVQEDFLEFTKYRKHYHQDGFIPRIPEIRQLQDFSITLLEQYNNYVLTAGKAYLDLLLELSPEIIVHEY